MQHPYRTKPALFIDIDCTITDGAAETPLPFAIEKINEAYDNGCMIVLVTMRGEGYVNEVHNPCAETLLLLKRIGLKYHTIIWNCPSPRIMINDEGAIAINHPANSSWERYKF